MSEAAYRPLEPQVENPLPVRQAASALRTRAEGIARTLTTPSVQPAAKARAKADLGALITEAQALWRKV